ncbi:MULTISPECIES: LPS translocon maturation chaperone LptM [sulfur-oxidizing symbionts]|uniref:LPS translocon maturation chaperone LptM n=1 Tax=Candidatus Endoriftia persephonae TaxID=393765 RepID=UPI0009D79598
MSGAARPINMPHLIAGLLALLLLSACGQKGPLYLPPAAQPQVDPTTEQPTQAPDQKKH